MRRTVAVALVVALLVGGVVPAFAASANVSVTGVTVTPETPLRGEDVTITATIRNLASSDTTYTIDAVAIRNPKDRSIAEYERVRNLGTLSPGSEIQVPLTISFGSTGTKEVRVVVFGHEGDGDSLSVQYPVVISVSNEHPTVTLETERPVAGVENNATLTLSNGLDSTVRNVVVSVGGPGVSVENERRAIPELESGESRELEFKITPGEQGTQRLNATVSYTTAGGTRRTVEQVERIQVEALRDRVALTAQSVETDGSRSVSVDVTNLGNAPLEDVVVDGTAANATVGTAVLPRLAPGQARTVTLPVTDIGERSRVTVTASYDVGTRDGRAETTVTVRPLPTETNPGRVTLTGIDFERDGETVQILGSASNVGLTEVNSVIVRVVPTDGVAPAPPNREYFVGTVPGSDFVSFDVFARVDDGVSTITLEVTYLSEGERRTELVEVPYDVETPPSQAPSGGGLLVPALAGVAVLAVIAVFVYLGWRNYRGGA